VNRRSRYRSLHRHWAHN